MEILFGLAESGKKSNKYSLQLMLVFNTQIYSNVLFCNWNYKPEIGLNFSNIVA